MKTGMTLQAFATEIDRQFQAARDFAPVASTLRVENRKLLLPTKPGEIVPMDMNEVFHDQLAAEVGIPKDYYRRILDDADTSLYEDHVNHWLGLIPTKERRMVRTLDSHARALLSTKYRVIDNYVLAKAVLPLLQDKGLTIRSSALTEKRFYIKAVNQKMVTDVKVGQVIAWGIAIGNSEVGFGKFSIQNIIETLSCANGAIIEDQSMKKRHLGRQVETLDVDFEVLKDDTKAAKDKAFLLEVRDNTENLLSEASFKAAAEKLRAAAGEKINGDVAGAVELTRRTMGLTTDEGSAVMKFLIEGGDISKWGLSSAVTRMSQDVESYDRATELERVGGQILELPQKDWRKIAEATAKEAVKN